MSIEDSAKSKLHPENHPKDEDTPVLVQRESIQLAPETSIEEVGGKVEFSIRSKREETREKIAMRLVALFAYSIGAAISLIGLIVIITIYGEDDDDNILQGYIGPVKDITTLVITAEAGLVGSALGFYFGEKDQSETSRR